MRTLITLLLIVSALAFSGYAQPLSFLGDISKLTPLECVQAQCSQAGTSCANLCPDSSDELVCKALCSKVVSRCYESRCFFNLRRLINAQAGCCAENKFGCVWDEGKGCIDSLQRQCGVNEGFEKPYTACINANLSAERGNISANLTMLEIPLISGSGSCIDSSECSGSRICYMGSCVIATEITPAHRAAVECLDDIDCPISKPAGFVCLNSSCIIRSQSFCRAQKDCQPGSACRELHCIAPAAKPVEQPKEYVGPAISVLSQWASSRPGIMARVSSVVGESAIVPGSFFSQGDLLEVPDRASAEIALPEGSRIILGPASSLRFKSFSAAGSDIMINFGLESGEAVVETAPLHEVSRALTISVGSTIFRTWSGSASIIAYLNSASKAAVMDGILVINEVNISQGTGVITDASGSRQVPISPLEQKRIEKFLLGPSPISPPPFEEQTFIEKYGAVLLCIIAVFTLALWAFLRLQKTRGKKGEGIHWQEDGHKPL